LLESPPHGRLTLTQRSAGFGEVISVRRQKPSKARCCRPTSYVLCVATVDAVFAIIVVECHWYFLLRNLAIGQRQARRGGLLVRPSWGLTYSLMRMMIVPISNVCGRIDDALAVSAVPRDYPRSRSYLKAIRRPHAGRKDRS
jgi:hypothetical protein